MEKISAPAVTPVTNIDGYLKKGKSSKFPMDIEPMLATLVDKPIDEPGWMYEIKWDGYRAIAYINNSFKGGELPAGEVDIRSRNNKSFNDKFYPLHAALKAWKINAIVDGEIAVLNEKGIPDFSGLQSWRSEADGQLVFYLFDILWLEGNDVMGLPLIERRSILRSIAPDYGMIKLSDNFDETGTEFFNLADKLGLEGIIAKKATSVYTPGLRTKEWLKIKTQKFQEAIICGYTKNENTSKQFSALLLGWYNNGELQFIGLVGTGFNNKTQSEILNQLKPLQIKTSPFKIIPDYNKPSRFRPSPPKAEVTWVKPEIVCEISYREITKDGAIRHPSFKGLRPDKNAKDVVREKPIEIEKLTHDKNKLVKENMITAPGKKERKTLLNPTEKMQTRNVGGHNLSFTNLEKLYWPKEKVSKRDMINYYYQAAPFILPYLKDRPQTLNRYPNGIAGKAFYQKDVKGKVPDWIQTFPYHSEGDGRDKEFLVASNEASLLYMASLGCIEMNPWSSRVKSPDNPDWCIIDLDPDKNTFKQVIDAACVTKKILDAIDVVSFCKTSGSTGLHIYIPFGAKYTYEDSKEFARAIAKRIHAELPVYTTIERKTADRGGKMYIDFLQNRPQATVAAPYSLRPKPGATVSMPMHWEEVTKGLEIKNFTINNSISRMKEQGDIFEGVLGKGINLKKALKAMESL
ncbi:MAG TPA: DNA ligase D [Chitinophagaceae bacterium]|nr:DNA ligase D [Chitinophagaceae bacterium]